MSVGGGGNRWFAQAVSNRQAQAQTPQIRMIFSTPSVAARPIEKNHRAEAGRRRQMRPTPPGTDFSLPEETPRGGRGQKREGYQARYQPRHFSRQFRVFARQDAENDQNGTQAESDRSRGPQDDTDQNRERTHTLGLIYTWLLARASLALKDRGSKFTGDRVR